jgi:hypothetical protein
VPAAEKQALAAANANISTEMAMKLVDAWQALGYGLDVVLYQKYAGSPQVDPDEEVAFKDLPNRVPSALSRDFRREQGRYEDFDKLYPLYLLYNPAKYNVRVDEASRLLEIDLRKKPMAHVEAVALATRDALADSESDRRGQSVPPGATVL